MSTLHQAAEDYLAIRRSLGFKLVAEGYLLASFVDYAERTGARQLTADLALDWATLPAGEEPGLVRQETERGARLRPPLCTVIQDEDVGVIRGEDVRA